MRRENAGVGVGPGSDPDSPSCRPPPTGWASRSPRSSLLANDIRNGVLVRLFDLSVLSPSRIWFVYPPRLAQSPKLVAFRGWQLGELEADPELLVTLPAAMRLPELFAKSESKPASRHKRL
jgi:DNA-binding transcriptional LysR family regulator